MRCTWHHTMLDSSRLIDFFSCNSGFDPFFFTLMFNPPSSNLVAFFSLKASAFNFPARYIDSSDHGLGHSASCLISAAGSSCFSSFPACISDSLTCCSGFLTSSSGSLVPCLDFSNLYSCCPGLLAYNFGNSKIIFRMEWKIVDFFCF